ncbi:hypothetical protein D9757_005711 [Collybiopsis confluens]|uniref:Uncharacterized protein n=1 Tax=Collybiopsis confluens TaxID=2823264 RepID=A0A8H5HQG5_9AGAR|nr:hypothetical protein D9757_005711 [Collybiopsis confluens]
MDDPEEILNSSLNTLYEYQPTTLSSNGSIFTYPRIPVTLHTPDTSAANWSLHASSIWVSSLYLADHIDALDLPSYLTKEGQKVRVLELGAGAGLPGIVIAKCFPNIQVTLSDFPDEKLIRTLSENIDINHVSDNCSARTYAWGSDPKELLRSGDSPDSPSLFHVIIAADTIWNPESHEIFIGSLKSTLRRSYDSRAHLVAGMHTGRYALQSFLNTAVRCGFILDSLEEKEQSGSETREWDVTRAEQEDEKERRRWLLWIILKWPGEVCI